MKAKKHLYCPKCNNYPDEIREYYNEVIEMRKWNQEMECYEILDAEYCEPESHCEHCRTKLIEKEQE